MSSNASWTDSDDESDGRGIKWCLDYHRRKRLLNPITTNMLSGISPADIPLARDDGYIIIVIVDYKHAGILLSAADYYIICNDLISGRIQVKEIAKKLKKRLT